MSERALTIVTWSLVVLLLLLVIDWRGGCVLARSRGHRFGFFPINRKILVPSATSALLHLTTSLMASPAPIVSFVICLLWLLIHISLALSLLLVKVGLVWIFVLRLSSFSVRIRLLHRLYITYSVAVHLFLTKDLFFWWFLLIAQRLVDVTSQRVFHDFTTHRWRKGRCLWVSSSGSLNGFLLLPLLIVFLRCHFLFLFDLWDEFGGLRVTLCSFTSLLFSSPLFSQLSTYQAYDVRELTICGALYFGTSSGAT